MEFFKFTEKKPEPKDSIIVKLIGCELDATHAFVYVRECEGLGGWFEEWRYASKDEMEEFGKKDCVYLKENKDCQDDSKKVD